MLTGTNIRMMPTRLDQDARPLFMVNATTELAFGDYSRAGDQERGDKLLSRL
jgi:hypothetical protein